MELTQYIDVVKSLTIMHVILKVHIQFHCCCDSHSGVNFEFGSLNLPCLWLLLIFTLLSIDSIVTLDPLREGSFLLRRCSCECMY